MSELSRRLCGSGAGSRSSSGGGEWRGPLRGVRERLDTFDWRLLRAGLVLEYETAAGMDSRLRLLDPEAPGGAIEVRAPARPRFSHELPAALLRRRLAPLMDVRVLLARNSVRGNLRELRIQDRRDKTVARVDLWQPARRGECIARVQSLRGYEAHSARISRSLGKMPGAEALASDPLWDTVSDGSGRPGSYPDWRLEGLDPESRSDDVVQRVLRHYRDVMALNIAGMRDGLDSEFLHDFRVGLRRSRTLVRRVPGLFPPARLESHVAFLAWLSDVTGPVRDADVHCLVFPDYAARLDARHAEALVPMFDYVRRDRVEAYEALAEALASRRFVSRWQAWERFLSTPMPRASRQPRGPQPAHETAAWAIRKAITRMRRQGRRIGRESPPEAYHELRKSGKNLRYLVDTFGAFFQKNPMKKITRRLKAMQDVLGEHQDLDVHRQSLMELHERLARSGELPGETHEAMEQLVAELARRSVLSRTRFPEQFEDFLAVAKDNQAVWDAP